MSISCISKSICYNDEWCKTYYMVNFGWFGFDHVYDVWHWPRIKKKKKNPSVLAFAFAYQVNYFGMWLCWLIIWFQQSSKPFLVVYACIDFKELYSLKKKQKNKKNKNSVLVCQWTNHRYVKLIPQRRLLWFSYHKPSLTIDNWY